MATTAGAVSRIAIGRTTASVSSAVATGGATTPYTYQWYRGSSSGFTPGTGNIISGATSLLLADTGLTAGTQYYYKMVASDSTTPTPVSSTSSALAVATIAAEVGPNQFSQTVVLGMPDALVNQNTLSVQIDASETGELVAGQAVKIYDRAGGVPKVVACSANSDQVDGFINYSIKDAILVAGDACEISRDENVLYLQATAPIARGAEVQLDVLTPGGVTAVVGSSGARKVGQALDKASGGELIRVQLKLLGADVA